MELLVRAKTNRVLGKDDADKLFDKVRKSPMQGKLVVEVKRLSAKASKQAAKAVRQPRQATVRLRYLRVELPAKRKAPVELTHVREENPPVDAERRFLLTTLPSAADAERTWYGLRWRRLFSRLEVRLQGTREPDGRAPAARRRHGRRLARPGPPRTGIARRPKSCSQTSNSGCWRSSPRRKDAPKNLGEAVSLVAALGGHTQTGSARFGWLGYAQLAAFFRELEDE